MDMVSPPSNVSMIPYSQEDLPLSSAPIRCVWKFYVAILKSPLSLAFGTFGDYRTSRIQVRYVGLSILSVDFNLDSNISITNEVASNL